MGVYVDRMRSCIPNAQWRWTQNCHLIADNIPELHEFAARLGLRREWFQDKLVPHYDLIVKKQVLAVQLGAREIDDHEMCTFAELWRSIRRVQNTGQRDDIRWLPPIIE